jgi:hypothetical protein
VFESFAMTPASCAGLQGNVVLSSAELTKASNSECGQ